MPLSAIYNVNKHCPLKQQMNSMKELLYNANVKTITIEQLSRYITCELIVLLY